MKFSQHPASKQWQAQVPFREDQICVQIDPIHPSGRLEELALSALAKTDIAWPVIERNLTESLHRLYNDVWADPEEDMPPLTEAEFLKHIRLRTVMVMDESDALSLYFSDSDLFGGHTIDIFWCGEKMHAAVLAG